ncbi:MAG: hypothetical protein ACJ8CX_22495, partial [Microvirga sp.]
KYSAQSPAHCPGSFVRILRIGRTGLQDAPVTTGKLNMGATMALHTKIALFLGWCVTCYGGMELFISAL